jgi:phospholipid/cholesterol/gamma-HCH transport system substrate-binding protein
MTRQAQVGAFALLSLLMLFAVFYMITDFGTRHTGYRVGIHFQGAAGLHSGALVYFSGVSVGSVDSITLLPDNTVDVILAVNRDVDIPRASRFLIQAPLTGDPNLIIVPPVPIPRARGVVGPTPEPAPLAMLDHTVLPVDQQPEGTNSATIADLLQQGQGEIYHLDAMLSQLAAREPKLLDTMQATLTNADELTMTMKATVASLATSLQNSLPQATANLVALTGTLNDNVQLNSARITDILVQFDQSSHALNASMTSLQSLAGDKTLRGNILDTTTNIAETTKNIAGLTHDLRNVTGDPQTQAELKNTIANLDATMQKANSLLSALGGSSNVYRVDVNATPFPIPSFSPGSSDGTSPIAPAPAPVSGTSLHLHSRLASIASDLISIQLRLSALSSQKVCCPNSLFSADRGPQTDLNATLLPNATNSLLVGANDIGFDTTANLAVLHSLNSNTRVGGGILYSQLGFLGSYDAGVFGINSYLYDPRRPELDLYGNLHLTRRLNLFYGERAINHVERRFDYGLSTKFP